MKKVVFVFCLAAFSLMSFTEGTIENDEAELSEILADALHRKSFERYTGLIPSVEELQLLMDSHAAWYGNQVEAAKKEFAIDYEKNIVPAYQRSFYQLIDQGEQNGINWQEVSIGEVTINKSQGVASGFIVLNYQGKEFTLVVEKLLRIQNQWKVSQYVRLQF